MRKLGCSFLRWMSGLASYGAVICLVWSGLWAILAFLPAVLFLDFQGIPLWWDFVGNYVLVGVSCLCGSIMLDVIRMRFCPAEAAHNA